MVPISIIQKFRFLCKANAPNQKRSRISAPKVAHYPAFCIWLLCDLNVIQDLINRKNPACHVLRSCSINLVYFIYDKLALTRII